MQPIVLAASPLTYAHYRKLSFADFRVRHTFFYITLPFILLVTVVVIAAIVAGAGITALKWQDLRTLVLMSGVAIVVLLATLFSLRQTYGASSILQNGTVYRLDEKGLTQEGVVSETILWSNIEKTAVLSNQWILLRQASPTSKEVYFLDTTSVMPPANRTDFYALLDRKHIKRI